MKVKELLSDKSKWAEGRMAYTKDNKAAYTCEDIGDNFVFIIDKETACRFCLMGAIAMCYNDGVVDKESEKLKSIFARIEDRVGMKTYEFNDGYGYIKVLALVEELDI